MHKYASHCAKQCTFWWISIRDIRSSKLMWQCQLNPMRRYGTTTLALSSSLYFLRWKYVVSKVLCHRNVPFQSQNLINQPEKFFLISCCNKFSVARCLKITETVSFNIFEKLNLADRSISIIRKLLENAKIARFKWDILGIFQTMWAMSIF